MVEQQNEQLTLDLTNDNLTCRLGWYYDPERTVTKSGQAIKKRPTYRLYQDYTSGDTYDAGSDRLDAILNTKRKPRIVLFFNDDNWQRINSLLQNSLEQKQFTEWHYTQSESLQQLKPLNDIPSRSVLRTMLSDFWNWLLGKE